MVLRTDGPAAWMLERRGYSLPVMARLNTPRSTKRFGMVSMARRGKTTDGKPAIPESWRPLFSARSMISMMVGRASLDLPFVFPRDDE